MSLLEIISRIIAIADDAATRGEGGPETSALIEIEELARNAESSLRELLDGVSTTLRAYTINAFDRLTPEAKAKHRAKADAIDAALKKPESL